MNEQDRMSKVYSVEGLEVLLNRIGVKVRDAMIPTTQMFKLWSGMKVPVVSEEDCREFYECLIPEVVKVWNETKSVDSVEWYLKDVKKMIRKAQKSAWMKMWAEERGELVRGNTKIERPLWVHGMVDKNRVPFEMLKVIVFESEMPEEPRVKGDSVLGKCDARIEKLVEIKDKEWMEMKNKSGGDKIGL